MSVESQNGITEAAAGILPSPSADPNSQDKAVNNLNEKSSTFQTKLKKLLKNYSVYHSDQVKVSIAAAELAKKSPDSLYSKYSGAIEYFTNHIRGKGGHDYRYDDYPDFIIQILSGETRFALIDLNEELGWLKEKIERDDRSVKMSQLFRRKTFQDTPSDEENETETERQRLVQKALIIHAAIVELSSK